MAINQIKINGPNSLQLCLHAAFWGEWIISGVNGKELFVNNFSLFGK